MTSEAEVLGRLWNRLHEKFGPAPALELRWQRHGYLLRFTRSPEVSIKTVRQVIVETVPLAPSASCSSSERSTPRVTTALVQPVKGGAGG
jgi:hypothetical protein